MYASHRPAPWLGSAAAHAGALALMLWIGSRVAPLPDLGLRPVPVDRIHFPTLHTPSPDSGGSGGALSRTPPSAGQLPKPTPRPWIPPQQRALDSPPPLMLDAGIEIA